MPLQSKILVIDDDTSTLEIILMVLVNAGYIVEVDSKAELTFLQNGNYPDLILLDNNLGKKTGQEICRELKSNRKLKNIPVILISAMENVKEMADEACADDFLSKPFGIQPLLEKMERLLGTNRMIT